MFKILQKLMIGIVIFLGTAAVTALTAIGGFLYFAYDEVVNALGEILASGSVAEGTITEIKEALKDNPDLIQNQIGLGLFISGVIVLGGIVVFGILGAVFNKKDK